MPFWFFVIFITGIMGGIIFGLILVVAGIRGFLKGNGKSKNNS